MEDETLVCWFAASPFSSFISSRFFSLYLLLSTFLFILRVPLELLHDGTAPLGNILLVYVPPELLRSEKCRNSFAVFQPNLSVADLSISISCSLSS
jgi:hypothetical protein